MPIEENKFEVSKTARIYTLHPKRGVAFKANLLALHGYRQLGKYFIQQFNGVEDLGLRVIVPEALNRFYIEGYSGRVGSSWMTKEAREDDIVDQINYLDHVYARYDLAEKPLIVLGFSQGGPSACRWITGSKYKPQPIHLILHSTVFPNDFDFQTSNAWLKSTKTTVIFGDKDQFADEQTISEKVEWMHGKGLELNLLRFHGGHIIHLPSILSVIG
jgi:predicted esterase